MLKNHLGKFIAIIATVGSLAAPLSAYATPETMPDGTIFDADYYAQNNPDVVAVFGTSPDALFNHYVLCGKSEGRSPYAITNNDASSSDFDANYYMAKYPDIVAVLGKNPNVLRQHYENYGKKEGRFPNAAAEQAANKVTSQSADDPAANNTALGAMSEYEKSILELVNQERQSRGIAPLIWNADLAYSADIRAREIVEKYDHIRPDGSRFFTVLPSGLKYRNCGENIFSGPQTPESAMTGWMNSTGHRNNILNSSYTEIGIGYYYDPNSYWQHHYVQIFVNPR